ARLRRSRGRARRQLPRQRRLGEVAPRILEARIYKAHQGALVGQPRQAAREAALSTPLSVHVVLLVSPSGRDKGYNKSCYCASARWQISILVGTWSAPRTPCVRFDDAARSGDTSRSWAADAR